MNTSNTASILASFATLKSLSDVNKYQNPYQILKEFIQYIITVDSLYCFSSIEMKYRLKDHFGFWIPEAVVKSSVKNIEGISLEYGMYNVPALKDKTLSLFEEKKKESDDYETYLFQSLCEYISSRTDNHIVNTEVLTKELISFLTDDVSHHLMKYGELIGEFILKNEHNEKLQNGLNKIREGSILYLGLSHNINETGSIKKPLNLYLGTEILFSLAGFNGEIYKQFANDFYEQVRMANSGESKKVSLYYFSEIKKEIDEFFDTAGEIVEGKKACLIDKPAMKSITNGCTTVSDIDVKKSDFYYNLRYHFGITEDPHDNYYDETYFSTNLESEEYDDDIDKNKKKETALKLISHVNKLRNGKHYHDDIESEHIIITNTKITLLISKEQTDKIKTEENVDNLCNFAISLDRITSLLWYKLGNGFSKAHYPSSVNALLKARTVLSSSIAKNADKVFSEIKKQYSEGLITADQVAARIITLRNKINLPEDLQGDDIEEKMDFSPEYLIRYEEQFKDTKNALKENKKIIETLTEESRKIASEKDETIALQSVVIKKKDDENEELRKELMCYKQEEEKKTKRKEKIKNVLKFAWSTIWKVGFLVALTLFLGFLGNKYDQKYLSYFSYVLDAIGIIYTVFFAIKKDWCKYIKNDSII